MRIKRKRFAFNRIRLFYFKEKRTTPLRHGSKNLMKHMVQLKNLFVRKFLITSQFSYARVVWMFHHINRIHERALRVVCEDHNSSFGKLLEKDNFCQIHERNLQKLATEIFKVKMNLASEIMKELFEIVEGPYAFRNKLKLKSRKIHSVRYGTETTSFVDTGAFYSVTLNHVNPLGFSSQRSKIGSLKLPL